MRPSHTALPASPDTSSPPNFSDAEYHRALRYRDHARRGRLVRFWRTAGPIAAAQFLLLAVFLAYSLIVSVRLGIPATGAAILIAPCALAYFTRNLFLRRLRPAIRALNIAGICLYAFFVYYLFASPTLPIPVGIAVLAYLPFHVSTAFWILSDPRMCPTRDRWWHGKGPRPDRHASG